jgi:hypothetical protein
MKILTVVLDNGTIESTYHDNHCEPTEPLTAEELGGVMATVLYDTLGDNPQMADIIGVQKAMMGALN